MNSKIYSRPGFNNYNILAKPKRSQFNFTWLFAIIAGAALLALAIYGAVKIGDTQRHQSDTEIAKTLDILTDPMQAGWADSKGSRISFKKETRINNFCSDFEFGKNTLSVATKSGIGAEWNRAGGEVAVKDKYIFSSLEEGKDYFVFSRAFEFPYKVSDLIFMSSKEYCFTGASPQIVRDVEGIGVEIIKTQNCSSDSVKVCFNSGDDCEIVVHGDENSGYVVKNKEDYNYVGNLLYGAIFSDKDVYDCNVQRLLYRTGKIAEVYIDTGRAREANGVGTNLIPQLMFFKDSVMNKSQENFISLIPIMNNLEQINNNEVGGLW